MMPTLDAPVARTYPRRVKNSFKIIYIRKIGEHIDTESEKSHNSVEDVICARCEKVSGNNSSLKKELETVSKLSYHLEKRCQEQEDLIYLLKQLNNGLNSKRLVAPSTSNRVNFTIQNDRSSEVSTEKGENVISEEKQNNQMRSQQKRVTNKQGNSQKINSTDVSRELLQEQSKSKMNQLINLVQDEQPLRLEIPIQNGKQGGSQQDNNEDDKKPREIHVGTHVIIMYSPKYFPGIVEKIKNDISWS
ncbi:hypothetical protein JTB14_024187 [Gonioctena quinquepunctata]|nr:hypothetical protein JTB14_024187 [Gonioctena quinquepunctata]